MRVYEGKSLAQWLDWLETDGAQLAMEERDVRVFQENGASHFGSLRTVSSREGRLTILEYDTESAQVVFQIPQWTRIEVFNSRRLRPDRAYAQMKEMERNISAAPDSSCN
jgi:hypothetical protein